MGSQVDLDQGGSFREWVNTYLGPSVGWVRLPGQNLLTITSAGTFTALYGTSLVTVNVAGLVTINLPPAMHPVVPAGVLPGRFSDNPITIVDIGGHALASNITIVPAAGENIMGLANIKITINFGGFVLQPNSTLQGWTSI